MLLIIQSTSQKTSLLQQRPLQGTTRETSSAALSECYASGIQGLAWHFLHTAVSESTSFHLSALGHTKALENISPNKFKHLARIYKSQISSKILIFFLEGAKSCI